MIVIWYDVWAINVVAPIHLVDDNERISPDKYFVATDVIFVYVIEVIDKTLVFSLVVGNTIAQVIVPIILLLSSI